MPFVASWQRKVFSDKFSAVFLSESMYGMFLHKTIQFCCFCDTEKNILKISLTIILQTNSIISKYDYDN